MRNEGTLSEPIDLSDGKTDKQTDLVAETPAQRRLGASGKASDRVRSEEAKRFVEQGFARLHAMPC